MNENGYFVVGSKLQRRPANRQAAKSRLRSIADEVKELSKGCWIGLYIRIHASLQTVAGGDGVGAGDGRLRSLPCATEEVHSAVPFCTILSA